MQKTASCRTYSCRLGCQRASSPIPSATTRSGCTFVLEVCAEDETDGALSDSSRVEFRRCLGERVGG